MRVRSSSDIGRAIRSCRKDAGISQLELAQLSGCSQRLVSQVEQGKPTAELGKVLSILDALGLTVDVSSRTRGNGRELVARTLEETTRSLEMANNGIQTRRLQDFISKEGADGSD